jgi:hypothetical protein
MPAVPDFLSTLCELSFELSNIPQAEVSNSMRPAHFRPGISSLQMLRAFRIACSNSEIARGLLEELMRRSSVADCNGFITTATGLGSTIIGEVRIVRITVLIVIPPVAVAINPIPAPCSHACSADFVQVEAIVCLIGDFYLIGA